VLELAQKTTNLNNVYLIEIITKINNFLLAKLKVKAKNNQYLIRTTNLEGNVILMNYLTKYPLFNSKFLYYTL